MAEQQSQLMVHHNLLSVFVVFVFIVEVKREEKKERKFLV
jgi:hypothetical protein